MHSSISFVYSLALCMSCVACTTTQQESGDCPQRIGKERDTCFHERALAEKLPEHCTAISAVQTRETCLFQLAVQTCNPSLCTELQKFFQSEECREEVSLNTECSSDSSLEEEFPLPGLRSDDETDSCAMFAGDEQDHCYQAAAAEAGDPLLCEKVRGERFVQSGINPPRDKCYAMVAVALCNPVICDHIQGTDDVMTPVLCKQKISQKCP